MLSDAICPNSLLGRGGSVLPLVIIHASSDSLITGETLAMHFVRRIYIRFKLIEKQILTHFQFQCSFKKTFRKIGQTLLLSALSNNN